MKCLVTGAAGFIGSHLVDRLLREGHKVVGVDKQWNHIDYRLQEQAGLDLSNGRLGMIDWGFDWVFHLAARTGLQPWSSFQEYLEDNVLGTQRLLEACRRYCPNLKRFVYASTSSVYGKEAVGDEGIVKRPYSPYGFTKLGGEGICHLYRDMGVPTTILRYFSVYGPRQREGMAIRKWIDAALRGEPLQVCCGSLSHTRSLTYVDDVVEATLRAAQRDEAVGEVFNVAGLVPNTIEYILKEIVWPLDWGYVKKTIDWQEPREGDQEHTFGHVGKASRLLGWWPRVDLPEGLGRQVEWQRNLMETPK